MDKQIFPTLDEERWTIADKESKSRAGGMPVSADSGAASTTMVSSEINDMKESTPISSVMQENVPTVDAHDSIDQVERVLSSNNLSAVPVIGSNGAIVGVIGTREISQFVAEGKNAKAVRAWEISRCKLFEVGPNDTADEVARLLTENQFDYIAVTELGAFKGMVLARELAQVVLAEKDAVSNEQRVQVAPVEMSRRHDD